MAQTVVVAGATYPDVPSVELPTSGGGTAVFADTSDATATAADIASGKTAYADGVKLTGTGSTGGDGMYYGVCSTAAATAAKVVTISGITALTEGLSIRVNFSNGQTYNGAPTLNVNGLGAKNIKRYGTTNAARYEWIAGEVIDLVYDGTYWLMVDGGLATTTYYGVTKLATSASSTSTALALTPASLNNLAQYMLSGVAVYSTSATYAVGDRVRYGYYIYECNTAITTAEAWTAAHWTALAPLLELIDDKADADNVPASGSVNSSGQIVVSNSSGTQLFTVQLPLYNGGAS